MNKTEELMLNNKLEVCIRDEKNKFKQFIEFDLNTFLNGEISTFNQMISTLQENIDSQQIFVLMGAIQFNLDAILNILPKNKVDELKSVIQNNLDKTFISQKNSVDNNHRIDNFLDNLCTDLYKLINVIKFALNHEYVNLELINGVLISIYYLFKIIENIDEYSHIDSIQKKILDNSVLEIAINFKKKIQEQMFSIQNEAERNRWMSFFNSKSCFQHWYNIDRINYTETQYLNALRNLDSTVTIKSESKQVF